MFHSCAMPLRARFEPTDLRAARRAPVARLAASQLNRVRRIVDAAVQLADKGGFEAVRLRDVADASEVALGTLYKYFHSKEDILLFALTEEVERLEAAMTEHPPTGGSPLARVTQFFERATRALTRRPQFARAVLRSLACGSSDTLVRVSRFHSRMTRLIVASLHGAPPEARTPPGPERDVAFILQNVWFASLIGWAGGLHQARVASQRVRTAAALMRISDEED